MRVEIAILSVLLSTIITLGSQAQQPSDISAGCSSLQEYLRTFPYKPVGECVHPHQQLLTVWNNIRTTPCCRNGLNFLSRFVANASVQVQEQPILLSQQQWTICTSQLDATLSYCGFSDLHWENGYCSAIGLSSFRSRYAAQFDSLLASCSAFDVRNFVERCPDCTSKISNLIDSGCVWFCRASCGARIGGLSEDFKVNDDETERAICSIATVTAVASNRTGNGTWNDDFYRCLAAMDTVQDLTCKIHRNRDAVEITLAILIASMALVLLLALFKGKSWKKDGSIEKDAPDKVVQLWSSLYRFSKAEIEKAISHMSERVFLGARSAGEVYRGVLPSGQLVAIKHIYAATMGSSFTREVEGLSRVRHHTLVSLLGYCDEDGDRYLVYEFCSNGNLAQRLRSNALLSWERRVEILRDCSVALRFLHINPDGCIVHRDIKLTNILLTEEMKPKLSDFGLARTVGMNETQCFTDVRGTIGYMDLEYMTNGTLTCSSDIYSFGMVMLQVLSGRKVIEINTQARDTLTTAAKDVIAGKRLLTDFVDPRLEGEVDLEDFRSILRVAVLCVSSSSKGRPRISDLVEELGKACRNSTSTPSSPEMV